MELSKGAKFKPEVKKSFFKDLKKEWRTYTLLILPVIFLIIFRYIPIIGNVIAFRTFVPGGSIFGENWDGLYYFKQFITDPNFWHIFSNTIILGFLTVLFSFPIPLVLALLINEVKNLKFKKFVQTASYLPHFLSIVIVAGLILDITSTHGTINSIIKSFGGSPINFMQDPKWYRPIYIISQIWQEAGWGTILYLAALTNIDEGLYEAAKMDGANRWKQTLNVTIPGILPTVITLLVLNVGGFLAVGFEKVLLTYNPLIYSTADVVPTYLFRVGMQSAQFSYAAAIGLFESIIGFVLVMSSNWVSRKLVSTSLW
jgi:putative aldouronate transport system permease protein